MKTAENHELLNMYLVFYSPILQGENLGENNQFFMWSPR